MLFTLLVNPLTGKDLDWADPSKHPSVPALGKAVINKCFTEVRVCACACLAHGTSEPAAPQLRRSR